MILVVCCFKNNLLLTESLKASLEYSSFVQFGDICLNKEEIRKVPIYNKSAHYVKVSFETNLSLFILFFKIVFILVN